MKEKLLNIIGKIALTIVLLFVSFYFGIFILLFLISMQVHEILVFIGIVFIPILGILLIWLKNKKKVLKNWGIVAGVYLIAFIANYTYVAYNKSITINTSPNIILSDYLPFDKNSKIVTLDYEASIKLEGDLPVVDGAAALFPVYSAFVNETYPDTTRLDDGIFQYNNTPDGYKLLAEKETDIFFGVYPSQEQMDYANDKGTKLVFHQIGSEAFVFFVHKDNPIESLTTEQIQQIYSGEITNWSQIGGKNEEIAAFQRNEGSGSQSMLERFMDGKPIEEAPTERVNSLMSGIIEQVADYKNKTNSIGFSFRYYVEGIIKNDDIKVIAIDGVKPTVENIKNNTYPITTGIYAVTYEGNDNKNVDKLLNWVLSDEGQEIIEKTGYVGIN